MDYDLGEALKPEELKIRESIANSLGSLAVDFDKLVSGMDAIYVELRGINSTLYNAYNNGGLN